MTLTEPFGAGVASSCQTDSHSSRTTDAYIYTRPMIDLLDLDPPISGRSDIPTPSKLQRSRSEPARKQTSIFYVDGPLPVQCIALSDSSEESISSKVERQAQVELYQSSSQMLHNRQLSGYQASSSLPNSSPSSPIPTPGSVSGLYTKEDSPEVMDWVDYSDPRAAMSEYGTTGVSISEADQGVDDLIPFVIHNEIKGKETVLLDLETVRELVRSRLRPVAAPFAPKKPSRQAHRPPQVVSPELPGSEAYHLPSSPTSVILEQKAIRLGLALPTKEVSSLAQETQPTLEQPNSQHMSCDGCGRKVAIKGWFKALPCEHIICSSCFNSALSSVSVSGGSTRCPSCIVEISTCLPLLMDDQPITRPYHSAPARIRTSPAEPLETGSVVLRIDNVAWDVTPDAVRRYFPPGVFPPDNLHPIHVLLDRHDGRTKDYLYVEVDSAVAARKVLQHCQNRAMPGGTLHSGRSRPVTITLVPASELVLELRPSSRQELDSLAALCQAALTCPPLVKPHLGHTTSYVAPSGLAHFVKSRHGPFNVLLSIMTKAQGYPSVAYFDLLQVTAFALSILGQALHASKSRGAYLTLIEKERQDEDIDLYYRFKEMFKQCFHDKPSPENKTMSFQT